MEALIARLDHWLRTNRAGYYAHLNSGVSDARLDAFEARFALTLPAAFRRLYRWRDGHDQHESASLVHNLMFASLENAAQSKELLDNMIGSDFEDPRFWRRSWVPFLENGARRLSVLGPRCRRWRHSWASAHVLPRLGAHGRSGPPASRHGCSSWLNRWSLAPSNWCSGQASQRTAATVSVCQDVKLQHLPQPLSLGVRRQGIVVMGLTYTYDQFMPKRLVTEEDIAAEERELEFRLPPGLRTFLLGHDGPTPCPAWFRVASPQGVEWHGPILYFFRTEKPRGPGEEHGAKFWSIAWGFRRYQRMPDHYLPLAQIATVTKENFLLISVAAADYGTVYLWRQSDKRFRTDQLRWAAASFDDLLARLAEPPEEIARTTIEFCGPTTRGGFIVRRRIFTMAPRRAAGSGATAIRPRSEPTIFPGRQRPGALWMSCTRPAPPAC